MRDINVALIQMATSLDVDANIGVALSRLDGLVASGARPDLVCLPEMFTFRALGSRRISEVGVHAGSGLAAELAARARRLGSYLVGTWIVDEGGGVYTNRCHVFSRGGDLVGGHRKTHLFDAPGHAESAYVTAGDRLSVVEADFGTFGIVVCYELRFPEVARTLALAGAECLVVPNSWPRDGAGRAREELGVLLAAAAVQNQAYVVHANQTGVVADLELVGGSCVIDPSGRLVASAGERDRDLLARLDGTLVDEVRARRLVFAHRRPELYEPASVVRLKD
ncbi:nitrilase-related carbon-nitrogen hydrolase [Microtetraspora sp. NBRC 16547]|uniref:carbon-nitrogen hydrolase family protein n=1 Tax=Microtetraspora sp. NBRC 16547 TaxID=3030993 RepID=UPI0024A497D6|nr:nitrilase-related carbon-nitrogen hydrolase [Microtetraspora sp. NBRC 16547]GLW99444.1 carbon-nitrogen hydrolase [Microtetraspora sp. NBRC 16547]